MPIDARLIEILVCPACRGSLDETETSLDCTRCGRKYPIRDGIPVMLVDEAGPPTREVGPLEPGSGAGT